MSDPDPASSALIAHLLAEDAGGYGVYSDAIGTGDSDSADSDYGAPKRKPKKAVGTKKGPSKLAAGRKRAAAAGGEPGAGADGNGGNSPAAVTPGARRKRKDTGAHRETARGWEDEEKAKFEAALAELGRDWKGIADRIGTRDVRAVASFAQKYLVRLAVAGVRVPPKVAETGEGYTLSGKPLDPRSASAVANGLKPAVLARLLASGADLPGLALGGLGDKENVAGGAAADGWGGGGGSSGGGGGANGGGTISAGVTNDAGAVVPKKRGRPKKQTTLPVVVIRGGGGDGGKPAAAAKDKAADAEVADANAANITAEGKDTAAEATAATAILVTSQAAAAVTTKPAASSAAATSAELPAPAAAGTDMDTPSPKKKAKPAAAAAPQLPVDAPLPPRTLTEYAKARPRRQLAPKTALGATTESLELLPLASFVGDPGSGAPLAQPFSLAVSTRALAVMDLHAHLCGQEVIGLLGGSWDAETRAVRATHAFPCARAAGSLSGTSVELDPEAEVQARASMDARGLAPVGWYHSHPVFAPVPSQKDADNQRNYQALFRCPSTGVEPFVGAIVGPYDPALPTPAAVTTWFVVASRGGDLVPFGLRTAVDPPLQADADLATDLLALAHGVAGERDRVDLGQRWRGSSGGGDGVGGSGDGIGSDGVGSGGDGATVAAAAAAPLTKGRKALMSLARHLAPGAVAADLLAKVAAALGLGEADIPDCGGRDDAALAVDDGGLPPEYADMGAGGGGGVDGDGME